MWMQTWQGLPSKDMKFTHDMIPDPYQHDPAHSNSSLAMQELRQRFLACREAYVAAEVAGLDDSLAYDFLKRLTDVHRLQLFDVVMQYSAVFSEAPSSSKEVRHTSMKTRC